MLRILMDLNDLGKVHFRISPQVELIGSIAALQERSTNPVIEEWRSWAIPRISPRLASVLDLVKPGPGFVPGFLVPKLTTRPDYQSLRRDLLDLAPSRVELDIANAVTSPEWRRRLSYADPAALDNLATLLSHYQTTVFDPVYRQLHLELHNEVCRRAETIMHEGLDPSISDLAPMIRWKPPHLEIDTTLTMDIALDGRGLCLVPSMFWSRPALCLTEFDVPALIYPVRPPSGVPEFRHTSDALGNLIGRTRALVMSSLRKGCSTGELARRAGISQASASEHVSTLRQSGLVRTERRGKSVHHSLTPIGKQLLRQLR